MSFVLVAGYEKKNQGINLLQVIFNASSHSKNMLKHFHCFTTVFGRTTASSGNTRCHMHDKLVTLRFLGLKSTLGATQQHLYGAHMELKN